MHRQSEFSIASAVPPPPPPPPPLSLAAITRSHIRVAGSTWPSCLTPKLNTYCIVYCLHGTVGGEWITPGLRFSQKRSSTIRKSQARYSKMPGTSLNEWRSLPWQSAYVTLKPWWATPDDANDAEPPPSSPPCGRKSTMRSTPPGRRRSVSRLAARSQSSKWWKPLVTLARSKEPNSGAVKAEGRGSEGRIRLPT